MSDAVRPGMVVQIIEPGLVAPTGHYFDYSLGIARELQSRGLRVRVQAQAGAAPEVQARMAAAGVDCQATMPPALQRLPGPGPAFEQALQGWLRQTQSWLAALAATASAPPGDLWLFPTLQAAGLFAVSTLPVTPRVVGLVHTPPLPGPWRQATETLQRAARPCTLLAIDPLVGEMAARSSSGLPVRAAPIPHGSWARREPADAVRCVGFFGNQRPERGQDHIAPLVQALMARGLRVMMHDSKARGAGRVTSPLLEVVPGFVDDLAPWIARCDLVLCPMDRERYRYRISGIATHALATGVPLVLPSGTLTAERWRRSGALLAYDGETTADILRAVDQVCANAAVFAAGAQRAAQAWQREHGLKRFVDLVLAAP